MFLLYTTNSRGEYIQCTVHMLSLCLHTLWSEIISVDECTFVQTFFFTCVFTIFLLFLKGQNDLTCPGADLNPEPRTKYVLNMVYLDKSPKNPSSYFRLIAGRMNQYDKEQPVPSQYGQSQSE